MLLLQASVQTSFLFWGGGWKKYLTSDLLLSQTHCVLFVAVIIIIMKKTQVTSEEQGHFVLSFVCPFFFNLSSPLTPGSYFSHQPPNQNTEQWTKALIKLWPLDHSQTCGSFLYQPQTKKKLNFKRAANRMRTNYFSMVCVKRSSSLDAT